MNALKNRLQANTLLSVTLILLLSACSDSNNNNNTNKIDAITVTSYNMGLALNFVPYTQERVVANEALVADYDSDVSAEVSATVSNWGAQKQRAAAGL